MDLILFSTDDIASMNILENIKSMCSLKEEKENIFSCEKFYIAIIEKEKIFAENIDLEIEKILGKNFEKIIVASRHRSESGMKSLTVHPIGNYNTNEFGGKKKTLVDVPAKSMTGALLKMNEINYLKDFSVNYEVTHHGPFINRPVFFIEIGSNENEWKNLEAGKIIAETILKYKETNDPIAIGIGGGHYAPRFTKLALKKKISFGHMASKFVVDFLDIDLLNQMEIKSNAKYVVMEKKDLLSSQRKKILEILPSTHLELLDPDSLDDR